MYFLLTALDLLGYNGINYFILQKMRSLQMEALSQIIQTFIVIIILAAFVLLFLFQAFYKGRKRQILVLKKHTTEYQGFNTTRSKLSSVQHYTVNCKYVGTGKCRTLGCSFGIYNELKENKKAVVIIKMGHIVKILK